MSNIDLSRLVSGDEKAERANLERAQVIREECKARILAVASFTSQMNLTAMAAAGLLSASQHQAWLLTLKWVADMRRACADAVADPMSDHRNDRAWPAVPEAVRHLLETV